jgi:hypothetical protein
MHLELPPSPLETGEQNTTNRKRGMRTEIGETDSDRSKSFGNRQLENWKPDNVNTYHHPNQKRVGEHLERVVKELLKAN